MKAAICDPIRRGWFILEGKLAESISWGSLPNVARIRVELAAGRREIVALLGGDWRLGDVRRAAAERRVRFHSQPGLGQLIRKGYSDRNSSLPPALEKNLRALDKPDTLAIVTGQQVGIFGGPLYTFYKAYTTILLAATPVTHPTVAPAFHAPGPTSITFAEAYTFVIASAQVSNEYTSLYSMSPDRTWNV